MIAPILRIILNSFVIFFPVIFNLTAITPYDWPQFGGNPQHSGNNSLETRISTASVASLHRLYQVTLPGVADGSPVVLNAVPTAAGMRSLVYLTTRDGWIVALDAANGAAIWAHQVPAGNCRVNNGSPACFTTSSPVVDPNHQFVYSYGLDGKVHKYYAGTGAEVLTGGWPEIATLKGNDEKGSSSLAVATDRSGQSYLYVSNSGYPGDLGDYQGHITVINLSDGTQKVFNALCADQPIHFSPTGTNCPLVTAGIWSRAPVIYFAATDRIYITTGNGDFDPAAHDWGDSVLALNPDGSGTTGGPLDSYTPANFQQLQATDADLGSTAPAILPAPAASRYPNLAVMGGKDQLLRLLNLDNLSGQGARGKTGGEIGPSLQVPQGGAILTQPAVWTNPQDHSTWIFVTTATGTAGIKLVVDGTGNPSLVPVWNNNLGASSPLMVNGVLFEASTGSIRAINPLNGSVLWNDTGIGGIHWESPAVSSGVLFISDESGHLTAYTP